MKAVLVIHFFAFLIAGQQVVASEKLALSPGASKFIEQISSQSVLRTQGVPNALDPTKMTDLVIKYKVNEMAYSPERIAKLIDRLGLNKKEKHGFIKSKSAYYYYDRSLMPKPLMRTDKVYLDSLRLVAMELMDKLMEGQEKKFVFANVESHFIQKRGEKEERLVKQTYRFVRKLNGHIIVDNTAYAKLSFVGNGRLAAFEFADPSFEPVPVKRVAKFSTIKMRLANYAAAKNSVTKSDGAGMVNVKAIQPEKGYETYRAKPTGSGTYLIPHISFYSRFELANGDEFRQFAHFSQDADFADDLTEEMIDSGM